LVSDGDYVAVFHSIHRVMKAEKLLKGKGLPVLLIPAPRSITSDCGLALRYGADVREQVETLLADASFLPEDRYVKEGGEYVRI
jgi:hypothetical protein